MLLPEIVTPTYQLVIPSSNKKIKYRPFLVKEEKILILANESGDPEEIKNAVKQVIQNCILTPGISVEELTHFDFEYLFLNLRNRSIGNTVDVIVVCEDDGVTKVELTIDIGDIKMKKDPNHNSEIDLGNDLTLKLKYPKLDYFLERAGLVQATINDTMELIVLCADKLYNKTESWDLSQLTKTELIAYFETMTAHHMDQIENFFSTMPKLVYETTVVNPKTKVENKIKLEGLLDFFAS